MLLATAIVVPSVIWLYLIFARGGFWRVSTLLAPEPVATAQKRVAVVIPARDEASVIGRTVASLIRQRGIAPAHVFIVDDNSSDGTAGVARHAAELSGRSDLVTVITGKSLEAGWSGKLWALSQGIAEAQSIDPDFLLLTDADITHHPNSIGQLVSIAETQSYDLVSFMVQLHCSTLAERALIPAFVFFFLKLYPPAWIRSGKHKTAGAAGGCILIRPEALRKAGGLQAIRSEVIDDCALAAAVKSGGGRVWLGLTREVRSTRSYESFGEIRRMISRTAFNQLGHSTPVLAGSILGLCCTYLLPPALAVSGALIPAVAGGTIWLAMSAAYLPMVRFYRISPLWALSLPLVALFYMGATISSAIEYWSGRGGAWKGRIQDVHKQ